MVIRPTRGVVGFQIDARRAMDTLDMYWKEMPNVSQEIQKDFGKSLRRSLRRSLATQNLIDTKYLYTNIKWIQRKNRGYLRMPLYGIALDRMRPHFVKFKQSRTRLIGWAERKGNLDVKVRAAYGGSIFVRPHPWIRAPVRRTVNRLPKIIKKNLARLRKAK